MERNGKKKSLYKDPIFWGGVVLAIFAVYLLFPKGSAELDSFADCLNEKGVVMYGTDWCPHCKNQKSLFGNSFKKVNYVNCDYNNEECLLNGVQGYPTWKISGNNYPGVQSLEKLSALSGCSLSG